MQHLSATEGMIIALAFGFGMLLIVYKATSSQKGLESFLAADRVVPTWQAALSIAVSWVWAPAIFVCSMQAYTLGLPGIFWFTVPNIACFFIFVPLAKRLRKLLPMGYTIPEFIGVKYPHQTYPHIIFLSGFLLNMIAAIVANSYAGGALLNQLTGIDLRTAILLISLIALSYSLISGLKASILTDVIQMIVVLGLALVLVPWTLSSLTGGTATLIQGLSGVDGKHGNIFDPIIAITLGIPMCVTLLTGPLADQMFVQRALAIKEQDITRTFVSGGLIFGLVPITLSLLGFIAAGLSQQGLLDVQNPEMVGPLVISYLLPKIALYAFTLMALSALCSTLDSALCAVSALGSIDIYKRYFEKNSSDEKLCKVARLTMIIVAFAGTGIALMKPSMLWTFLVSGCITGSLFFPIIFALYSEKIKAKTIALAVSSSLIVSIPLSIFANITDDKTLVVVSSLSSVLIGLVICFFNRAAPSGKELCSN